MKKAFASHSEVTHVWAQQKHETGYCGNITFHWTEIYSYGWYCIAKFINPDTVLITDNSYSSATAKHIRYVENALDETVKRIYVRKPLEYFNNTIYLLTDIEALIMKVINARRLKNRYISDIDNKVKYINALINMYGDRKILYKDKLNKVTTHLKRLNVPGLKSNAKEYELKRTEKSRAVLKTFKGNTSDEVLNTWRNNLKYEPLPAKIKTALKICYPELRIDEALAKAKIYVNGYLPYICLKVSNTDIVTSLGAKVPTMKAKILLALIEAGKDIKGYKIGYYTVIGLNGTLKIGCHEIPLSEIEYIKTKI